MWEELVISGGKLIVILVAGYFIIKTGIKNGIKLYLEKKDQVEKIKQQLDEYNAKKNNH